MAIDNVNWTIRPKPIHNDGEHREKPKRKPSKPKKQPRESGKRDGGIDELA